VVRKRKVRRVQYEPHLVLSKVMNSDFLRTLVYVVYTAKLPVGAGEIAEELSKMLGKWYSHAYVSTYLRRLERWGVVRPYRDPNSGRLLWWRVNTKTAELISEELQKSELRKILQSVEEI